MQQGKITGRNLCQLSSSAVSSCKFHSANLNPISQLLLLHYADTHLCAPPHTDAVPRCVLQSSLDFIYLVLSKVNHGKVHPPVLLHTHLPVETHRNRHINTNTEVSTHLQLHQHNRDICGTIFVDLKLSRRKPERTNLPVKDVQCKMNAQYYPKRFASRFLISSQLICHE